MNPCRIMILVAGVLLAVACATASPAPVRKTTPTIDATLQATVTVPIPTETPTLIPDSDSSIETRVTPTFAAIPTPTHTPVPTAIPAPVLTATPAPTHAPVPRATSAPTPAPVPTATPTPTPTPVPTATPPRGPSPEAVAAIEALPWVQDGLEGSRERSAEYYLRTLATETPEVFWALMGKSWSQSDSLVIGGVDFLLVSWWVTDLALNSETMALRIVAMPFMETLGRGDYVALKFLHGLFLSDRPALEQFLSLPALRHGVTDDHNMTIPLLFLETRNPEAATAIWELPWVKNGMDDQEPLTVLELQRLALSSEEVFWAFLQEHGEWGGDLGIHSSTIRRLASIATVDEEAALQILEMPFLETLEIGDVRTIGYLQELAESSLDSLQLLLSHPELEEGITAENLTAVWLLYQLWSDPEVAAALEGLSWVEDGIAPPWEYQTIFLANPDPEVYEQSMVVELIALAQESREAFLVLARKPWLQDGLLSREVTAIYDLVSLGRRDESSTVRILDMPFLESIEDSDLQTLKFLLEIVEDNRGQWLLSHPTLPDGITDHDRAPVALLALEARDPDSAKALRALPWVVDGIDKSEQDGVLMLQRLASGSHWTFRELMLTRKPWIEDGLTSEEVSVVEYLMFLSAKNVTDRDEAAAIELIGMPFLDEVDRMDVLAIEGLLSIRWPDQNYMPLVLSHPTLAGGITDDLTKIIAVMGVVENPRHELLEALLDLDRVSVEERHITLPLAGGVLLSVVRVDPGLPHAMDWLEDSIRSHEEFMEEELPVSDVVLFVADATSAGGGGSPLGILTVDPERGQRTVAHEAAHIYWYAFQSWVAEGGAEMLTDVASGEVRPPQGCSLANSLAELDQLFLDLTEERGIDYAVEIIYSSACDYILGRSLFAELYHELGSDVFQNGFRDLYSKILKNEHEDECWGLQKAVCYVKAAFVDGGGPDTASIAEAIIDRRYHGSAS